MIKDKHFRNDLVIPSKPRDINYLQPYLTFCYSKSQGKSTSAQYPPAPSLVSGYPGPGVLASILLCKSFCRHEKRCALLSIPATIESEVA